MSAKLNNEPLVSVIMTSYNYARLIGSAVESVMAQDYQNWELIIADDGSVDNSVDLINGFIGLDGRISLLTHPCSINKGLAETIRLAMGKARGDIIAFLESDDEWCPHNLSEKVGAIAGDTRTAAVFSSIELTGESIQAKYVDYLTYIAWAGPKMNRLNEPMRQSLVFMRNPAATFSNMVFKKDALQGFAYDTQFEKWLDWQFIIYAAMNGTINYIPKPLVKWRIHSGSLHYRHMKSGGSNGMLSQRAKFIQNQCQKYNLSINKLRLFCLNLEFALKHPCIAARKVLNPGGY